MFKLEVQNYRVTRYAFLRRQENYNMPKLKNQKGQNSYAEKWTDFSNDHRVASLSKR